MLPPLDHLPIVLFYLMHPHIIYLLYLRTFDTMASRLTLTTVWIGMNAGLLTTLVGISRMTTVPVLKIITRSITKATAFSTPGP